MSKPIKEITLKSKEKNDNGKHDYIKIGAVFGGQYGDSLTFGKWDKEQRKELAAKIVFEDGSSYKFADFFCNLQDTYEQRQGSGGNSAQATAFDGGDFGDDGDIPF